MALLIKSFRDPCTIHKFIEYPRIYWSFVDQCVKNIMLLMRRATLTSTADTAGSGNKGWVEMVLRDPNPELAVLKESAKYMAKLWSSERGVLDYHCFTWLCGYANKVRKYLR